jgi:hypothetical protein
MATETLTAEAIARAKGRAYVNLIIERPGLAEAMIALVSSGDDSVIAALRSATAEGDPAQIDTALRAIIRTAQQARKSLAGKAA